MSEQLKKLVERRHPDHKANAAEWSFIRKALEGGPDYVEGNLFKHPKEAAAVYAARKARAADHHVNFTSQVRDTYTGYLFQQPPASAAKLPDWLERFIAQGDSEGRPLSELAKDAAGWELAYGLIWIGVDKPRAPVDVSQLSQADEEALGLEPYAYLVHPTHVLDGKIERGVVKWLLLQEDDRDDVDPLTSSGDMITRWRLWTPTEWLMIGVVKSADGGMTYQVIDKGPNTVGRVPFVPLRYGAGCGFACPGLLGDVAHLDRAIFNQSSLKDEILYAVTFPQLGVPFAGDLYEEAEDGSGGFKLTSEGAAVLRIGLHNVIPYNAEAGAPAYFSPDNGPIEAIGGSIDKIVRLLLGLALLDGEQPEEGGPQAGVSGLSKAYTFEKLNRRLASIADGLEAAFRAVFDLVALWLGKNPEELPEGVIWEFPDSFEVRSLAQDLEEFAALMAGSVPSTTAKAELWLAILRKAMPKVDAATWKTIEEEVRQGLEDQQLGMGAALDQLAQGQLPAGKDGEDEDGEAQDAE